MKKIAKKSTFSLFFILLLLFFSSLLLFSCGKTIPIEKVELTNTFTQMYVNESRYIGYNIYPANANNYFITISSSDKSVISIDREGYATARKNGTATITLSESVTGTTLSFDVEVGDGDVYGISYNITSFKAYYYEGENIDISNLIVYRNFISGKQETLPKENYTVDYPPVAEMNAKIKITYTFNETEFVIEIDLLILEDKIESISVSSPPNKTSYNYGEVFDKQGLKVVTNMKSGRALEVEDFTFDDNPIDVGQTEIKIYYKDYETSVNITAKAEVEVSTINELQDAIMRGVKSINLNGLHSLANPIILDNVHDLIIVGNTNCQITGNKIIPIRFVGNCENNKH